MPRSFNLADLFAVVAETVPDRDALVAGERRITYRELDQRITRLASALHARGVKRGDNVGIDLYNSIEFMESYFACCRIGAVPVNLNYRYVSDELSYVLNTLDIQVLIYTQAIEPVLQAVAPSPAKLRLRVRLGQGPLSADTLDYESLLTSSDGWLDGVEPRSDDHYILCTGGTTGMPKGVIWPHRAMFMAALGGGGFFTRTGPIATPEQLADNVLAVPAMSYVVISPLMHGAGLWSCLISLFAGSTVVLNERPSFDAEYIWDLISRERVAIMSVVGDAMALPLIQALERQPNRWDLSQLRVFGNGGAVFSVHLQERIKQLVPGLLINNGMGSSESGAIQGGERTVHGEGFMRYAPRPDLAVIDHHMQRVTAPGVEGVLARTGDTPVGYYGDAKKTAETFVHIEGQLWILTGDRVRIDADGYYAVLGRGNLCINSGGEKIFPEEVEEAIRRYPAVRDCRAFVSGYKVPRAVYLVEQIKRSPVGKADYRWAKSIAQEQVALA